MEASEGDLLSRGYGAVLWEPDDKTVRQARVTRFMSWLEARHQLHLGGYEDLWQWSVSQPGLVRNQKLPPYGRDRSTRSAARYGRS